ncbi:MAG: YihY/virulence factor BrkB family protein [Blastocatellia bacterium]|nr:YihY/virulence factor BrkB family protein [Blastocatellia bacterium]MCS7157954.1 YihY/virulence factor BrkB family protein [Blastocatellia bacterium]MCX7752461.1 YihY/virulence factor BrkB family protein [Blastocatellia bacterium]MDW8167424.1 YihY/virulence factor BrkB family protein [Acidobacteriota bacterium]MDW8257398.1 YihY/virulence factor BrkB family protein [Acidobacteriota bacterium]
MAQVPFATLRNGVPKRAIVTSTFSHFLANELPTSAAAISYFAMLGLYPFLLLLFTLSQEYPTFRELNLRAIEIILAFLPASHEAIRGHLSSFPSLSRGQVLTCLAIILWVASWAFTITEKAINRIWRTPCRSFVRGRLLTLAMLIVVGILLVLSALMTGLLTFLQSGIGSFSAAGMALVLDGYFWQVVFGAVGLVLTVALFLLVYKIMPNTRVTVIEALPGALIAGLAWEIAKYLFAWSLVKFPYDQLYGSIAAVVATLTWIYISSLIMLFGAQMTAVLHCAHLIEERGGRLATVRIVATRGEPLPH